MGNKVGYCVSCKGLVFKSAWWYFWVNQEKNEEILNNSQVMKIYLICIYVNSPCLSHLFWLCRSHFGREFEVICHNYLDSHRVEEDKNYWEIITRNPGPEDGTMLERHKALPQGYKNEWVSWKDREYKSPRLQPGEVDEKLILVSFCLDFRDVYFKSGNESLLLVILHDLINSSRLEQAKNS